MRFQGNSECALLYRSPSCSADLGDERLTPNVDESDPHSEQQREGARRAENETRTKHRGENKAHTKWRAEALNEKDEEEVEGGEAPYASMTSFLIAP